MYSNIIAKTAHHSTSQHSTAQHNTTQHNTTQHNTTQSIDQSIVYKHVLKTYTCIYINHYEAMKSDQESHKISPH